jgi:hypothetical protein
MVHTGELLFLEAEHTLKDRSNPRFFHPAAAAGAVFVSSGKSATVQK